MAKSGMRDPNVRYGPGVERPHVWVCGPDPYKHSMYVPWMKHRAQASYRQEDHTLTFEQFYELWKDHWEYKGRAADDYCLTRIDPEKAWSQDNCELRIRKEYLKEKNQLLRGRKYRPRGMDIHKRRQRTK